MEYTEEIEIARSRDDVVRLFLDPDRRAQWQRGLQSSEVVSGEAGQPGAVSRQVFLLGRRRTTMVETITANDLPDSFSATYDSPGVHNTEENDFVESGPDRTTWRVRERFSFSGSMRIVGTLFKGIFPKQTRRYLVDFKAYAEDGVDVRD